MKRIHTFWNALKNSGRLFWEYDTFTHGAALSYFMLFSFAPIIIMVIAIVGLIFGDAAVQGDVKTHIEGLLGSQNAEQVQELIKAAYKPGGKVIATIISTILLIVGATSVFAQLRTSLNTIWDVKPKAKEAVMLFFINRLFSLAMIVCIAFLLLVSLMVQIGITAFMHLVSNHYQGFTFTIYILEFFLSLGFTSILFALIYKYMSDERPKWRRVWLGALFTAVLFNTGKYIIGLYITKSNMTNGYGAAGFLVLLLVWVFYSSQILFFGAQFTRALATEQGVTMDPNVVEPCNDNIDKARI